MNKFQSMGLMKAVKHAPPKDASPTNPALALAKLGTIMYHLHPLYIQYSTRAQPLILTVGFV
jgi:hypothetical protein